MSAWLVARRQSSASRRTVGAAYLGFVTGTGLNTFGESMLHYQTVEPDTHFAQAHNDYLQLAAEGGLLVGIPILAALFFFVREVRRRFRFMGAALKL